MVDWKRSDYRLQKCAFIYGMAEQERRDTGSYQVIKNFNVFKNCHFLQETAHEKLYSLFQKIKERQIKQSYAKSMIIIIRFFLEAPKFHISCK